MDRSCEGLPSVQGLIRMLRRGIHLITIYDFQITRATCGTACGLQVKVRGLPFEATEFDVTNFFEGVAVRAWLGHRRPVLSAGVLDLV